MINEQNNKAAKKQDSFRYTFRFAADPEFMPERDIADLARFVNEAKIDDVAVFIGQQDINTGHLTLGELEKYRPFLEQIQAVLAAGGASLSINQWYTIMHEDLGQRLKEGQDFRLMEDVNGSTAGCCVCPLDENWQSYLCDCYAWAAAFNPEILWVEDDFRYHNHAPLEWGGCFCEKHMALYSERAGKALSRKEFAKGVCAVGEVHPYRKIWLDTCRETQEAIAERLGQAVRKVSKTAKVGLMSSAPEIHAAEGRHWGPLLSAFAAGRPMVDRVHLPSYVEGTPMDYIKKFNMVSMLSRHYIPREAEIYPELENYPYSLFSNSHSYTRFQLLSSLPLNEKGVAMNLFDLNGNGIAFDEGWQDMLHALKPFLNSMTEKSVFSKKAGGVYVMCSEDSAYTLHSKNSESFSGIYPEEGFFGGLLPSMGIPAAYCSSPDIKGEIIGVSGQYFRNLSGEQLRNLFASNSIILNGDAAYTLWDMGFGELAGIKSLRWMRQNSGEFSYEQTAPAFSPRPFGTQRTWNSPGRASNVIFCCDALNIEYSGSPVIMSSFHNMHRQAVCPAQVISKPGVYIYPFGNFASPLDIPYMLFNPVRQALLQKGISGLGQKEAGIPIVNACPHLIPYYYSDDENNYLYLVNAGGDTIYKPALHIKGISEALFGLHPSFDDGRIKKITAGPDNIFTIPCPLPSKEAMLLEWGKHQPEKAAGGSSASRDF